jgi:membrane protease YdiL (CAAX protease family)
MLAADYLPQILAHQPPRLGYPLTPGSAAGWLVFEGLYVGPTEEIPFRSMLVPFLMAMLPARVRLGRFEMHWAGIIVALIFALLHVTSFASRPWPIALGQQAYALALGILYAYWLEKSGSILAPIVGHNASDGVEYILLFAWVGLA